MTDSKHKDTHPPTLSLPLPQTTVIAPTGVILSRKHVDRCRYFAGFTAGCVSRTLTAPIDRLKVLRQAAVPEIYGLNMYRSEFVSLFSYHIITTLTFCG
ncbi:unnamed protein product [Rodentolepis nana]|uniref:ADP/ATP translocase n=1 Tax=Rodentolepis nana TaxID=102285 RepID=A0A0R3T1F5_RODNA|nr:unnamed protein product [Rodentolepis nana]